jgi:hypothetical protein
MNNQANDKNSTLSPEALRRLLLDAYTSDCWQLCAGLDQLNGRLMLNGAADHPPKFPLIELAELDALEILVVHIIDIASHLVEKSLAEFTALILPQSQKQRILLHVKNLLSVLEQITFVLAWWRKQLVFPSPPAKVAWGQPVSGQMGTGSLTNSPFALN